jgi:YVTN family beta-propeller protein
MAPRALCLLALGLLVSAGQAAANGTANPQVQVGGFPTGITLDPLTDTIYVANGSTNTLSLIDGRTCNAAVVAGCGHSVTALTAGADPIGSAVDESTRTLYVANSSGTLAVVNDRRCDTTDITGCHNKPVTVPIGSKPQFVAVDEKTDTIYVANMGSNTVSVIDGVTCNASSSAGCRHPIATVAAGPGPFAIAVDDQTNTIYVADLFARTVSVIDGRSCDASQIRGCRRPPSVVEVGGFPGGIALDQRTDTVYVTGQSSNEVWVIDGKTCNDATSSGCRQPPAHVRAGLGARGITVDQATDTVYVANTFADTVSVIDGATCNATVRSACDQNPAAAPVGISPRRIVVDPRTETVYVTNAGSNTVTMLNGRTCDGKVHSGCGTAAPAHAGGLPVA